jgi:hypothetical protein
MFDGVARALFHRWERRLASATKDRVVRPFEWGLDWVDVDGQPPSGSPAAQLAAFAEAAVARSAEFFHAPPTTEYVFDGETLRFPSAVLTPHPENNTVYARYFRARPRGPGAGRRRAVLILPHWNARPDSHVSLARIFARVGISALRLSLPYHDRRMPPELHRADYIVSANIGRTLQVCRQAVLDARRAVAWLAEQGYERIGILGTSLGSCLAMLTTAHEPLIRAGAYNHVSPFFADVVWRGLSTSHVRAGLDGHIDLQTLRRLWLPISPLPYLERVRGRKLLLVYARYDLTFPEDLSRWLIQEFETRRIDHEVVALPCGHYTTGLAPFSWLDGYVLVRFLHRHL